MFSLENRHIYKKGYLLEALIRLLCKMKKRWNLKKLSNFVEWKRLSFGFVPFGHI